MVKKPRIAISDEEKDILDEMGFKSGEEVAKLRDKMIENAPPWEEIAPAELKQIEESGQLMAARAESYYYGYMRSVAGVDPQASAIVGAVVGSTVGTVVGQIVGKKLDKSVNVRDMVVRDVIMRGGGPLDRF